MAILSEKQRQQLLHDLNRGTNLFGPLSFGIRSRICAAVNNPSQRSWEDAHSLIITSEPLVTLWQAVLDHSEFDVRSVSDSGQWPRIPTQEQILAGLSGALGAGA